jgi:dTDP-4-dehydrorhamnose 3,5-epimerase
MIFKSSNQGISSLKVIEWNINSDKRGSFSKLFSKNVYEELNIDFNVKQINLSHNSIRGTLRGMHYQSSSPDSKLVTSLRGSILDIAVDIRSGSDTFLEWQSVILDSDKGNSFYIPGGFAHGFITLTDDVKLLYLHDEEYLPENQCGINPFDPALSIDWKNEVESINSRDKNFKFLNESFKGIKLS